MMTLRELASEQILRFTALGRIAGALLSGLLLILIFPRFDLGFLAWVCLVPLLLALECSSLRAAFGLSYLTGLVAFSGVFSWVWTAHGFKPLAYVLLMAFYLPHWFSLWGLAYVWIRRITGVPAFIVAPLLWVTQEYARVHVGFLSEPGMMLSQSQYLHPTLLQLSSWTGAYGLSFLIVGVNAAVASGLREQLGRSQSVDEVPGWRSLAPLGCFCALIIASVLYGSLVLSQPAPADALRVTVVQANIPQETKWDSAHREAILSRYAEMTRQAHERFAPDLIIWPETSIPGDIHYDQPLGRWVGQVASEVRTPLLVGSSEFAKFVQGRDNFKYYNSMFLVSPNGTIGGQYRKMVLFPFGEYDPLEGYLAWPPAIAGNLGKTKPGMQYSLLAFSPALFGAPICWEVAFPDHFRELARRGAHFVVNSTNETWFGDTAAAYHLLSITVFRAAEHRVPIIRAANSGLSAFIDRHGRITSVFRAPDGRELFTQGLLTGQVPLVPEPTFYTRYGDVFAGNVICLSILLGLAALRASVAPARIETQPQVES